MSFEMQEPLPAEKAKTVHPKERQNERNLVQHALMARAPEGADEWAMRYAAKFGHFFDTDEYFYVLVRRSHFENDPKLLQYIQERLDQAS